MFDQYLDELIKAVKLGNATEHTHRPAFQKLMLAFDGGLSVTNEPKRIDCGAPDFLIQKNGQELGYIEAKDIGISLNRTERTKQLQRYFAALGNLILTDYLEFRWYMGGVLQTSGSLGSIAKNGKFTPDQEGQQRVKTLIEGFLSAQAPQAKSPKDLAEKMASLAQLIRDAIATKLTGKTDGLLFDQYKSFQKVLIPNLTRADFADMYAQTICYGLFAARCSTKTPQDFSRRTAAYDLPKTNPFLRDIFDKIAGIDLDDGIGWAVDILANILKHTDMAAILADFGKRTRREDPVVHFYETFLVAYNPKMRKARGVYYTPEPVVSYIVRSVDHILKEKFGIKDGLASKQKIMIPDPQDPTKEVESHQVLILDPAVGTGTFLHGVIDHIYEGFKKKKGMWSSYVGQHLLPRLFGFELLMAPYTVAHMKLGLQLQELGYEFDADERLKIYLTNTLQEAFQIPQASGFMTRIKDEAEAAKEVKQEWPVMVVLGNPPYSYNSSNNDPWIVNLVRDYYQVDGKPLGERNPKGLQDDYVKFIRFAQHRIEETGYGVVAFITNHGYLDNPTFRGMRQNLMQTFDEIYILDLHGNSKKKETCPDGSPDENVFDIQQGVAIGFFIKNKDSKNEASCIYHADIYGLREIRENKKLVSGKYYWLGTNSMESNDKWNRIFPSTTLYLFKDQDLKLIPEYENGWIITDILHLKSTGVRTHRDHFALSFDLAELQERVGDFRNKNLLDSEISEKYKLKNTRDWKIEKKRKSLSHNFEWKTFFTKCLYRPFDLREYYHHEDIVEFPKNDVVRNILNRSNFSLLFTRPLSPNYEFSVFLTVFPPHQCVVGNKNAGAGASYLSPLYVYPSDEPTLFDPAPSSAPGGRRPNLDKKFIQEFAEKLNLKFLPDGKGDQKKTFGPEDIFNYIYGVFHSPTYRTRYAEFLKIDFPRVPLTSNKKLFWQLVNLGNELVQIHLMNQELDTITGFPIEGNNIIEKIRYTEPTETQEGRVYINKTQYIDNVPPDIYNFYIGGYQVCHKWLKDRKGREFSDDDFEHYSQIVAILQRTQTLMTDIDQAIAKFGGFPIQ